jgi:integrase
MRYEWIDRNPIKLAVRRRTLALLDAGMGLRISELLASLWRDQMIATRAWLTKARTTSTQIPIEPAVVSLFALVAGVFHKRSPDLEPEIRASQVDDE